MTRKRKNTATATTDNTNTTAATSSRGRGERDAQKKYRKENPDRVRFTKQRTKYFKKARTLLSGSTKHDHHWSNSKNHIPLWQRIHPNTSFDVAIHYSFWLCHQFLFGYGTTPNTEEYPQLKKWLTKRQSTITPAILNAPPTDEIKAIFEQVNEKKRWFPLFSDLLAFWATFVLKTCPKYTSLFMVNEDESDEDESERNEQVDQEEIEQEDQEQNEDNDQTDNQLKKV